MRIYIYLVALVALITSGTFSFAEEEFQTSSWRMEIENLTLNESGDELSFTHKSDAKMQQVQCVEWGWGYWRRPYIVWKTDFTKEWMTAIHIINEEPDGMAVMTLDSCKSKLKRVMETFVAGGVKVDEIIGAGAIFFDKRHFERSLGEERHD